jgi:hypothetical protein
MSSGASWKADAAQFRWGLETPAMWVAVSTLLAAILIAVLAAMKRPLLVRSTPTGIEVQDLGAPVNVPWSARLTASVEARTTAVDRAGKGRLVHVLLLRWVDPSNVEIRHDAGVALPQRQLKQAVERIESWRPSDAPEPLSEEPFTWRSVESSEFPAKWEWLRRED